jgi:acyl carrier protein
MNRTEIIEALRKVVKPYIQDEEAFNSLSEATDLVKDLKINSANLVDVILDVEDAFDIRIEDEEMDDMLNVRSTIDLIERKVNEKA